MTLTLRTYDVVVSGHANATQLYAVDESLEGTITQRLWTGLTYIEAQSRAGICEEVQRRLLADNDLEELATRAAALEAEVLDLRHQL